MSDRHGGDFHSVRTCDGTQGGSGTRASPEFLRRAARQSSRATPQETGAGGSPQLYVPERWLKAATRERRPRASSRAGPTLEPTASLSTTGVLPWVEKLRTEIHSHESAQRAACHRASSASARAHLGGRCAREGVAEHCRAAVHLLQDTKPRRELFGSVLFGTDRTEEIVSQAIVSERLAARGQVTELLGRTRWAGSASVAHHGGEVAPRTEHQRAWQDAASLGLKECDDRRPARNTLDRTVAGHAGSGGEVPPSPCRWAEAGASMAESSERRDRIGLVGEASCRSLSGSRAASPASNASARTARQREDGSSSDSSTSVRRRALEALEESDKLLLRCVRQGIVTADSLDAKFTG